MNKNDLLKSGGYAKKQIFSNSKILKWSHLSRFKKGVQIIKQLKPESIVDYGCGDATFLVFLEEIVKNKNGIEIDTTQLKLLKERFINKKEYSFFHTNDELNHKFDVVTNFEVLEHCTDENLVNIISNLKKLCKKNGYVIISVPKETGGSLLIKQFVRRLLSFRNYGSYEFTEWYSVKDFITMFFATKNSKIDRNFYEVDFLNGKYMTCGHKGFNWKSLKNILNNSLEVESVHFSPNILLSGFFASQVWFVCKNKD